MNTSLEGVACWTSNWLRFFIDGCVTGYLYLRGLTLKQRWRLLSVPSLFVFLVYLRLCQCRVTSDFTLVSGAVGVDHLCPPYLGARTQPVRGVGVLGARLT